MGLDLKNPAMKCTADFTFAATVEVDCFVAIDASFGGCVDMNNMNISLMEFVKQLRQELRLLFAHLFGRAITMDAIMETAKQT
jgi:dTDP-4-amino-4,6-dideoxygalactose transaminase